MPDTTHLVVGRCTTEFDGTREQRQHGDVLVLVKPDGSVLVHDAAGYQPVAWLTRAESVTVTEETIRARDGDQRLEVTVHDAQLRGQYPTTDAGIPVGSCPDCGGDLVRTSRAASCPDCTHGYSVPSDATVLEEPCSDCGLPRMRVERGASFVVCLDRNCESLDERVRATFDREWSCRECGDDLRVLRRGGLLLGCASYPDCEAGYAFPAGRHEGTCDCGLPTFETPSGQRCLDSNCDEEKNG